MTCQVMPEGLTEYLEKLLADPFASRVRRAVESFADGPADFLPGIGFFDITTGAQCQRLFHPVGGGKSR